MNADKFTLDNIPRHLAIDRNLAASLVSYVALIDGRIQPTQPTVDIWEQAFSGMEFGLVRDTIDAWFLHYRNDDYRPVIDPANIRRQAQRQMEVENLKQKSIAGPPQRTKQGAPRWFIERMQNKHGMFKDRNLDDYRD